MLSGYNKIGKDIAVDGYCMSKFQQQCHDMQEDELTHKRTWYIRRDHQIEGPFPTGLISQYILLERVNNDTELSHDLVRWMPLSELPELIPAVMKTDLSDPQAYERYLAARRWADERSRDALSGQQLDDEDLSWDGYDRRHQESLQKTTHHTHESQIKQDTTNEARTRFFGALLAVTILVVISAIIILNLPPPFEEEDACSQPPRPGINWSNCLMEGANLERRNLSGAEMINMNLSQSNLSGAQLANANLSYSLLSVASLQGADLRSAKLIGASLRGANLTDANLEGADLSYADLKGADINGADFKNAKLDNTIWIEGQSCAPGSLGKCNVIPQSPRKRL